MVISPEVGISRPPIRFSKVVFPEPDGPTIAANSASIKSSVTSFTA